MCTRLVVFCGPSRRSELIPTFARSSLPPLYRDHVDLNIINPRLAVEPDMVDVAYQPLSKAWDRARLVHIREIKLLMSGLVVFVDRDGHEKSLEADGIVVATGSVQPSSLMVDSEGRSKEERRAQFVAFREAVEKSAKGVLIVGGGTTGVELAGEIKTDFPQIDCTLVNKPGLLLRGSAKRGAMHNIAMKHLSKLGVRVINDDYIEGLTEDYMGESGPKQFTTKKGVEIEADVVVICAGGRPNVPFPAAEAIDERTKGLIVNSAMLCNKIGKDPAQPVWAVGDCTCFGGRGIFAESHIAALSASIAHFEENGTTKGGPEKYMHKPSESFPTLISVGRRNGAATVPFANAFLGKQLKCKDLAMGYIYKKELKMNV